MIRYLIGMLCMLALLLSACTIDNAIRIANTAADIGDKVQAHLAESYKAEQEAAVDVARSREGAEAAVKLIRQKFAPYWDAYRKFRQAWLILADTINAVRAGQDRDIAGALTALIDAERILVSP